MFEKRRYGLGCPRLCQVKNSLFFDLTKSGAVQTETSLFKHYDASERAGLLDE